MAIRNLTDEIPGLVALGGDLSPERLLLAYQEGIFPWPIEGLPLPWFCPEERAILEFKELHIPRSLARACARFKNDPNIRVTIDHAFEKVITASARTKRPGQQGTWITPGLKKAYIAFHKKGHAHSLEVWEHSRLIGGIYGVDAGGVFAGESMFYTKPYASKFALLSLIDHLKTRGSTWMDIQVLTPHMGALGAREIPREEFLEKLKNTLKERQGNALF